MKNNGIGPSKVDVERAIRNYDSSLEEKGNCERLSELIHLAAGYGADVNVPTKNGTTLFHEICSVRLRPYAFLDEFNAFLDDIVDIGKRLLAAGYDTSCKRVRSERCENLPHPLLALAPHLFAGNGQTLALLKPLIDDSLKRALRLDKSKKSAWVRDLLMGTGSELSRPMECGSVLHTALSSAKRFENKAFHRMLRKLVDIIGVYLSDEDLSKVLNQKKVFGDPKRPGRMLSLSEARAVLFENPRVKEKMNLDAYGGGPFHQVLAMATSDERKHAMVSSMIRVGVDFSSVDSLGRNVFHCVDNDEILDLFVRRLSKPGVPKSLDEMLVERDANGRTPIQAVRDRYDRAEGGTFLILCDVLVSLSKAAAGILKRIEKEHERSETDENRFHDLKYQLDEVLSYAMRHGDSYVVQHVLPTGVDPSVVVFDTSETGPYESFFARSRDSFERKRDVENLVLCVMELRRRDPVLYAFDFGCPNLDFVCDRLNEAAKEDFIKLLNQDRETALCKLTTSSQKTNPSDWKKSVRGLPLAHYAAIVGKLPEEAFVSPAWKEVMTVEGPLGASVARSAMLSGHLPDGWSGWSEPESDGRPLAYYAAWNGKLPNDPKLLEIWNAVDNATIEDAVNRAAAAGIVQKNWRNPPGLNPNENPYMGPDGTFDEPSI